MSPFHSSFFPVLITFSLFVSICFSSSPYPPPPQKSSKNSDYKSYVKTACSTTTYPSLCNKTLTPYAGKIKANPTKLAVTAISVALSSAQSASTTVSSLSKQRNLSKYEAKVVKDCFENMGDSIDELKDSIKQMNNLGGSGSTNEIKFKMSNVKTWMSAAITNENTCMDGFDEGKVSNNVKKTIRGCVLDVAQLTSVALALCNHLQY